MLVKQHEMTELSSPHTRSVSYVRLQHSVPSVCSPCVHQHTRYHTWHTLCTQNRRINQMRQGEPLKDFKHWNKILNTLNINYNYRRFYTWPVPNLLVNSIFHHWQTIWPVLHPIDICLMLVFLSVTYFIDDTLSSLCPILIDLLSSCIYLRITQSKMLPTLHWPQHAIWSLNPSSLAVLPRKVTFGIQKTELFP